MPRKGIPDRWLDYSNYGQKIEGTVFVAFKVPLKEELCHSLASGMKWTPDMALRDLPRVGLIVDLTNTHRYYDPQVFVYNKVMHLKIRCEGHGKLPDQRIINRFYSEVDNFINEPRNQGKLIGVHCTHGLNRTGFFICRYMIDRMAFPPSDAITAFNAARGHKMERPEYLDALSAFPSHSPEGSPSFGPPRATSFSTTRFPLPVASGYDSRGDYTRAKSNGSEQHRVANMDNNEGRYGYQRSSHIENADQLAQEFASDVRLTDHRPYCDEPSVPYQKPPMTQCRYAPERRSWSPEHCDVDRSYQDGYSGRYSDVGRSRIRHGPSNIRASYPTKYRLEDVPYRREYPEGDATAWNRRNPANAFEGKFEKLLPAGLASGIGYTRRGFNVKAPVKGGSSWTSPRGGYHEGNYDGPVSEGSSWFSPSRGGYNSQGFEGNYDGQLSAGSSWSSSSRGGYNSVDNGLEGNFVKPISPVSSPRGGGSREGFPFEGYVEGHSGNVQRGTFENSRSRPSYRRRYRPFLSGR